MHTVLASSYNYGNSLLHQVLCTEDSSDLYIFSNYKRNKEIAVNSYLSLKKHKVIYPRNKKSWVLHRIEIFSKTSGIVYKTLLFSKVKEDI